MKPQRAKLFIGIIAGDRRVSHKAGKLLLKKFGPLELETKEIPFSGTRYYEKEIGKNLTRRFICFKRLIDPGRLAAIKNFTIGMENKFSRKDGSRLINIDPGYVTAAKMVLATTKNFQHRIYLKDGIFAEVTLRIKSGKFQPLEWTYPDYKTRKYLDFFNEVEEIYKEQIK